MQQVNWRKVKRPACEHDDDEAEEEAAATVEVHLHARRCRIEEESLLTFLEGESRLNLGRHRSLARENSSGFTLAEAVAIDGAHW